MCVVLVSNFAVGLVKVRIRGRICGLTYLLCWTHLGRMARWVCSLKLVVRAVWCSILRLG